MTTQQLQVALGIVALCTLGGPVLVLYAFFHHAELLIVKKRRRRVVAYLTVGFILMHLTSWVVVFTLPHWVWLRWMSLAVFMLALVISSRRARIWLSCAFRPNDEWTVDDIHRVMAFAGDTLHFNLSLERVGDDGFFKLTINSWPEVVRRFKLVDMAPEDLMREIVAECNRQVYTTVKYTGAEPQDVPNGIRSITLSRRSGGHLQVTIA